ncbi:MAG: ABC transporter ATP-binding protein [Puniceicoccaceae bacterium]
MVVEGSRDPLVEVSGIGKIFCRDLRRSLWYGLRDSMGELTPWVKQDTGKERKLRHGEFWANHGISFQLKAGESLALVGHNGAGKTTLLKILNGLVKPNTGTVRMRGRVGALIALQAGFNPILTGRENIYVYGAVLGLSYRETRKRFDEIVEFSELGEFIDTPVQNYSSGMAIRLGFSVAVHLDPDILLLDEVLSVGDADFRRKCFERVEQIRRKGTAFILVSHDESNITRFCNRAIYLEHGRVKMTGNPEQVLGVYQLDGQVAKAVERAGQDKPTNALPRETVTVEPDGFYNAAGERIERCDSNERVSLIFRCRAIEGDLGEVVMVVRARDEHGLFFEINSSESLRLEPQTDSTAMVRLTFEGFQAVERNLTFSLGVWNRERTLLHCWSMLGHLMVQSRVSGIGRYQIPCHWAWEGNR